MKDIIADKIKSKKTGLKTSAQIKKMLKDAIGLGIVKIERLNPKMVEREKLNI